MDLQISYKRLYIKNLLEFFPGSIKFCEFRNNRKEAEDPRSGRTF